MVDFCTVRLLNLLHELRVHPPLERCDTSFCNFTLQNHFMWCHLSKSSPFLWFILVLVVFWVVDCLQTRRAFQMLSYSLTLQFVFREISSTLTLKVIIMPLGCNQPPAPLSPSLPVHTHLYQRTFVKAVIAFQFADNVETLEIIGNNRGHFHSF